MVAEGSENKALKQAGTLAMDDIEKALLTDLSANPPAQENTAGSFEKLMRFGGHMSAQGQ